MTSPSMGVESILKSPVWTTVPMRVWMAKATESAMEWFTWMNSGLHRLPGLHGHQLRAVQQAVLLELQPDQPGGEAGAVNGQVDLLEDIGDGPDVVLVAVGDEQAPQTGLVLHQIRHVRYHAVDAVHIVAGEGHAAVHHDHVLAILQDGDIFTDFVETAQGDDFQFFCHIFR